MNILLHRFPMDTQAAQDLKTKLFDDNQFFPGWADANRTIYGAILPQLGVYLYPMSDDDGRKLKGEFQLGVLPETALMLIPKDQREAFQKRLSLYATWFVLETQVSSILDAYTYALMDETFAKDLERDVVRNLQRYQYALGQEYFQSKFLWILGCLDPWV